MTLNLNIPLTIAILMVVAFVVGIIKDRAIIVIPAAIIGFISFIVYDVNTPEAEAKRKAEAEAARLAAIPHVIREADGCKVYAFSAGGREHFFTRCAESVTTERTYSVKVPCGKNCTREEPRSEVIITSKGP